MSMSPEPTKAIEIFYSYAHEDEKLREQLEKQLSILKRRGVITDWHDRRIGAGKEWKGEIDAHLNTAYIILLLISASFLASDYCYDVEMKRAMERHEAGEARVIPIILHDCLWKDARIGELQALPTDAKPVSSWPNRHRAFANIARGIRAAVEELSLQHPNPSWSDWVAQQQPTLNDLVECAARLCELLAADHASGTWHQALGPVNVTIEQKGNPTIQVASRVPAGTDATTERAADLHAVGSLLYQALVGNPPPADIVARVAALSKVRDLSPSLARLLLRATNDPPNWPGDDPKSWAKLLRATQTGCLLADQLATEGPWPVDRALALAIQIGDTILPWRNESQGYVPPAAELILLSNQTNGTPES